jgi:LysM repeat protein
MHSKIPKKFLSLVISGLALHLTLQNAAFADQTDSVTRYQVQRGDTLSQIAKKFYKNFRELDGLVAANHLTDANLIFAGQYLVIPNATAVAANDAAASPAKPPEEEGPAEAALSPASSDREPASVTSESASPPAAELVEVAPTPDEKSRTIDRAKGLEGSGDLNGALVAFRGVRMGDPGCIEGWFGELRVDRKLGKIKESQAAGQEFAQNYPDLKEIPFIRKVLAGDRASDGGLR